MGVPSDSSQRKKCVEWVLLALKNPTQNGIFSNFIYTHRALLDRFGIMGLQGKKLGLWDYTLFEIWITEIMFEIGIMGFQSNVKWDF